MKVIKYWLIVVSVFFLYSCEKETEGLSRVTYFCNLTLLGDATEIVSLGGVYTEPGWIADENGVDVSNNVEVTGTVNTSVAGLYRLTYSSFNSDGFAKTAVRQVIVCDVTPSPLKSGVYDVSPASDRNGTTIYGGAFTILIFQVSPGRFYVSDLLGGYYEQRAGYGSLYAATGNISLAGDNTISLLNSAVQGWGDSLSGMVGGLVDPETGTVKWTALYAGYNFNVILTPQ